MLKQKHSNENGYTLFLSVLIGVLFMVMATTLLTITMNGITRNDFRANDIQATELSEKGIVYATNMVQAEIQKLLGNEGLTSDEFETDVIGENGLLYQYAENYACHKNRYLPIPNEDDFQVCIEDVSETEEELGASITFKSKGKADEEVKESYSTFAFTANAVPDALNYVIATNKKCQGTECETNGEGNLFLQGGVQIEGDMKVDGNIITTNRGYFDYPRWSEDNESVFRDLLRDIFGNLGWLGELLTWLLSLFMNDEAFIDEWISTVKPMILPAPDSRSNTSRLVLNENGNIFTFNHEPPYENHINSENFSPVQYKQIDNNNLNEAFLGNQEIMYRSTKQENIDIAGKVTQSKYSINDVGVNAINSGSNRTFQNMQMAGRKTFGYVNEKVSDYGCGFLWLQPCYEDVTEGNFNMVGNNKFGEFATDGNLTINNSNVTIETGMYVGGNLTIGNMESSNDPEDYETIEIDGPIYVEGDLVITGVDTNFNALIYVGGDVEVYNSIINGKEFSNGTLGTLIIFANGEISILYNSVFEDEPSNIRGYFYSNSVFEMEGIWSNMKIEGGISARRIVLNGIRGRVTQDLDFGLFRRDLEIKYQGEKNIGSNSRLQVIYNPNIIGTYSDLEQSDTRINNINPPKLIERSKTLKGDLD